MFAYSFPNRQDDFKTRLTYALTAEFIYRLHELLENEQDRKSQDGSVPAEILGAVTECADTATHMLFDLQDAWKDPSDSGAGMYLPPTERPTITNRIVREVAESLNDIPFTLAPECTQPPTSPMKRKLLATLGADFFIRLATLCESLSANADGAIKESDVAMVRSCIESAMGMSWELKAVTWSGEPAVPASVFIAMRGHIDSDRLACAGPPAVALMEEVYRALAHEVRSGA